MDPAVNQARAPQEVKNLMNFLRSKSGMKLKNGVLNGKRAMYFKGKSAVKALLSPAYQKTKKIPLPLPQNSEQACSQLASLLPFTFFLKVERGQRVLSQPVSSSSSNTSPPIKSRILSVVNAQTTFTEEEYYVWIYEGSQITTYLGGIALVGIMLAGVMFPLWPASMRLGVWYLSVAMLGLMGLFFAMAIFRVILFAVTYFAVSPGIWLFPNLFEDVGFVDSFIPLWAWNLPKKRKSKKKKDSSTTTKKLRKSLKSSDSPTDTKES